MGPHASKLKNARWTERHSFIFIVTACLSLWLLSSFVLLPGSV